ncbi:DciA family protein [Thermosynechococcus sp.]|uniref:DciA family protein n=1 Tax=Thermosynechococcus sp. TaxID=2814275 RepID=UPI0039189F15
MAYTLLATVLQQWQQAPEWQQPQQFLRLLEHWPELVGAIVAEHTVPLEVTSEGVLLVAVASSTWAHHLMFSRSPLMGKIQQTLGILLSDICFSHRDWRPHCFTSLNNAPLLKAKALPPVPPAATPQEAFQRWQAQVRRRSQDYPFCPRCQCPTPIQELQRWGICGLCYTRQPRCQSR